MLNVEKHSEDNVKEKIPYNTISSFVRNMLT